jgi:hypothetical protein
MNKKIAILGSIHLALGGGGMAACAAAYLYWIKLVSDAHSLGTLHTVGQMMFMVSVFILLPSFICGIGLVFNTAWGRVVAIGWSTLLLLVIPIGTLLGGVGLWILLKQQPQAAAAGHPVQSQPSSPSYHPHDVEPRKTSWLLNARHPFSGRAGLLLVLLIVGASMVVLLRMGFWIAGQRPPSVIVEPFYIAAVLLFAINVALIVVAVRNGLIQPKPSQLQHTPIPAASPPLSRDALCAHLQPIETAMRGFGISITQPAGQDSQAHCQIDRVELALVFGPTVAALYAERHDIDRSYLDPKTALFWCEACNSRLWVVHGDTATSQTPWFPENAIAARTAADLKHI